MDRYMSVGDAAKRLGVVPATVKLMARSGRLVPAARTVGGIALFDPRDVERLADERRSHGKRPEQPDGSNCRGRDREEQGP